MGEMINAYKILVEKPQGMRPFGRPTSRWRIILKYILEKYVGMVWIEFVWLRIGTGSRLL
jgi:hypothetical protein